MTHCKCYLHLIVTVVIAIMYTSLQLPQLCRPITKAFKRGTKAVYDDLNAPVISYATPTHRATTDGRKQNHVIKAIPVKVTTARSTLYAPSIRNNIAPTVNTSNLLTVKWQQRCTNNSRRAAVVNTRSQCQFDKCQQGFDN